MNLALAAVLSVSCDGISAVKLLRGVVPSTFAR